MKKYIVIVLIFVALLTNINCVFADENEELIDKILKLEEELNKLKEENIQINITNDELLEFKNYYDKDEIVQYYKNMQSDYQNTIVMIIAVFSILITIGVVVVPIYSKYQEKRELDKIKKYLDETRKIINKDTESNRMLKLELDKKLEINRIVLEAKILESTKSYYEAIELIKEAIEVNEEKEYYDLLSYYYELDNEFHKSVEVLEKAFKKNKYDAKMIYKLADKFLGEKEYAEALKYFKIAIGNTPQDFKFFYSIGKTYEAIEDYENAILNYKKTLELNPILLAVYIRLAKIYIRENDENAAINLLKTGNYLVPNNIKLLDILIDLMTKNGLNDDAKFILDSFEGDISRKIKLESYFKR